MQDISSDFFLQITWQVCEELYIYCALFKGQMFDS